VLLRNYLSAKDDIFHSRNLAMIVCFDTVGWVTGKAGGLSKYHSVGFFGELLATLVDLGRHGRWCVRCS